MQEITTLSRWTVGAFAALRSFVPLVPGFITRALLKSHLNMDEGTADAIGAGVGAFVKFLYSVAFAKSVQVSG